MDGNDKPECIAANDCALLTSFVMFFCALQQIFFGIEQPLNSLLFKHVEIAHMLDSTRARRIVCCAGALGASTVKPLEIHTTWPMECANQYHQFTRADAKCHFSEKDELPQQLASKKGKWTCGNNTMKASAAYPVGLCENIAAGVISTLALTCSEWHIVCKAKGGPAACI